MSCGTRNLRYADGGRSQLLAGAYAEECRRVAAATGVLFLDLHSDMLGEARWRDFLSGFPLPSDCGVDEIYTGDARQAG